MMRAFTRFIAPAILLAVSAEAGLSQEQARLRAGEHGAFSRIALDVPALGEWRSTTRGRTVEIRFPGRELKFDTRHIFPERRVSRVAGARTELIDSGTSLFLSLSCDCVVEAYEFQPGMLVVDLRPADAAPESAEATAPAIVEPVTEEAPAEGAAAPLAEASPPEPVLVETPPDEAPAAPAQTAAPGDAEPAKEDAPAPEPASPPDALTIAEAQRRLLEQLTRAADQGLVDFRPTDGEDPQQRSAALEAPSSPARPEQEAAPPEAADPAQAPEEPASIATEAAPPAPPTLPRTVQLDARTVFDRDRPAARELRPPLCPEEAHLDPRAWQPPKDPMAEIAALRGRMIGEFDRANPSAVLALARLQTGLGFGVEARETLRAFAPDGPEAELLADLAAVLDGGAPSAEGPLARAETCSGRIGAWRLAAGLPPPAEDGGPWIEAALEGFGELPVPLRRRVGPGLVETLLASGALDAAEKARLLLDRAPGDHGDAWRLALGRLALARGETEKADALLAAAAAGGGPSAITALIALAETRLAQGGPLPEEMVADLAAGAFALRGSEEGERLLVAEILGRAGRRQLGIALETVDLEMDADPDRRRDLEAALQRILEQARADEVGAMDYAAAVLAHRGLLGETPAFDAARIRVAQELTSVGLANVATELLQPPLGRAIEAARLAMAEAEIAAGDPASALVRLDGLVGAAAVELRARALAAQGRHREAYLALSSQLSPDAPERAQLAWLGSAWTAAASLPEDDPRRTLADRMVGSEARTTAALGEPSLSGARALLDDSASIRRDVEEALDGG